MHIKQIIIQGFKSYKDQTVIEPFSPKHNVIVGRNGSGKSNFFAAIRFVLSDKYTQLSREDRQGLLHEGAGSAVMNAYVEIIFDNHDDRFPTGTPEVVLRRTIGQKKDEYSLNRKNTTKQEVMNILESAGFSRSNPYYIVPQGRVTAITNMKDSERLNMLKTVAGTEVYESRRAESRKIMEETETKRGKIDELLGHIRGRLDELEEEKEELRAFQDKDRERRCLEYTIHRKEQDQLQERLDEIDEFRETGNDQSEENREALQDGERQLEAIDSQIAGLQRQIKLLTHEKATYKDERIEAARAKAKVEFDLQAIQASQAEAQQAQTDRATDLRDVQNQIKQSEAELTQLLPKYNSKREQKRALEQQLHEEQASVQRLYAKQNRQAQFNTKKERDDWLRKEIAQVHDSLATRKAVNLQTAEDISELESQIGQLETEVAELRDRIGNRGDVQQDISAEVQRAKDEKERFSDQRRELWRESAKLDSVISNARSELEKAEKFLSTMMDQNTSRGLAAVRKIVKQEGIQGAYGPLGELFEVGDRYRVAAEVTAGASLFHYVVDDDDIAERLIHRLKHDKLGRVTFVPLNRIKVTAVELPKASDSVSLISRLKYDERLERAMRQVFGKTIVCPNLQVAAQYARSHSVSAITPDGDRSDQKGALTGGFYDSRKSRIDAMAKLKAAREEVEGINDRKDELARDEQTLNQKVTKATSELQKIEQRRNQLEDGHGFLREERRSKERDLSNRRSELANQLKRRENIDSTMNELGNQLSAFESELSADFKKALSNQEERDLARINSVLPELGKQVAEAINELSELEGQKSNLEDILNVNLRPRLEDLQSQGLDVDAAKNGPSNTKLKERKADLKRATKALETLDARVKETDEQIDEHQQELQTAQASQASRRQEVDKLEQAIRNHQKNIEKNAQRKAQYQTRISEVKSHINALGVLPDAAFTAQYTNMGTNAATQRLHKVQESLKKYGHVNKKAFEQFKQFEQQRTQLEERRKELDKSDGSIKELIDVLDQRKDEAIQRTFRQVDKAFTEIFQRLVPAGYGRLIMRRRDMINGNTNGRVDDESDNEDNSGGGIESYTGVGISVSFNSKHDDQQQIGQLSGGQKSLCALGLVFAIQASDPAPFYLFDEIDANLDAQYRTAVADLLKASAETGQFICTTFRREQLDVADKCYGVSYLNKASSIDVVSREQALNFVEGQISGK